MKKSRCHAQPFAVTLTKANGLQRKSKQFIRQPTDKSAKKREGDVLGFLCDLCVLCGFS
jgi:hypothetical protein